MLAPNVVLICLSRILFLISAIGRSQTNHGDVMVYRSHTIERIIHFRSCGMVINRSLVKDSVLRFCVQGYVSRSSVGCEPWPTDRRANPCGAKGLTPRLSSFGAPSLILSWTDGVRPVNLDKPGLLFLRRPRHIAN